MALPVRLVDSNAVLPFLAGSGQEKWSFQAFNSIITLLGDTVPWCGHRGSSAISRQASVWARLGVAASATSCWFCSKISSLWKQWVVAAASPVGHLSLEKLWQWSNRLCTTLSPDNHRHFHLFYTQHVAESNNFLGRWFCWTIIQDWLFWYSFVVDVSHVSSHVAVSWFSCHLSLS